MKKLIYLSILAIALCSCSADEDPDLFLNENTPVLHEETAVATKETAIQEPQVKVQKSAAIIATLAELKGGLTQGRSQEAAAAVEEESVLCFQFVYPIVLEYSDGAQITVDDYDELLKILLHEHSEKYVTGIGFPFQVVMKEDNSVRTIVDEEAFSGLIEDCGYNEINYTYIVNSVSSCFEINYPLDLVINDMVKTFKSREQVSEYFKNNWSSSKTVSIAYPFRVTMSGSGDRVSISNDFEMINLIKNTCGID